MLKYNLYQCYVELLNYYRCKSSNTNKIQITYTNIHREKVKWITFLKNHEHIKTQNDYIPKFNRVTFTVHRSKIYISPNTEALWIPT